MVLEMKYIVGAASKVVGFVEFDPRFGKICRGSVKLNSVFFSAYTRLKLTLFRYFQCHDILQTATGSSCEGNEIFLSL